MSDFELTRGYLDASNTHADCSRLTERIEFYRNRESAGSMPIIVAAGQDASVTETAIVPEVVVQDLTAEKLRAAILQHGGLIVRNMFSDAEVDALKYAIDQVLAVFDLPRKQRNQLANPYFNPPDNMASIMPGQQEELASLRYFNRGGGAAMCAEAPSVAEALLKLYEKHGLKTLLQDYLGEAPCLSVKKWVLRRSVLPIEEAGWHQDGAFMGVDINSLNLWMPLTHCGGATGAPGMDIVPKRLYQVASSGGATFDWSVSDERVQGGAFNATSVAPVFNAGDAFFFDHLYLHRTQFREDISKVRYAVETWFFGANTFPKSQVPLRW